MVASATLSPIFGNFNSNFDILTLILVANLRNKIDSFQEFLTILTFTEKNSIRSLIYYEFHSNI
jgi:hypothetical protein